MEQTKGKAGKHRGRLGILYGLLLLLVVLACLSGKRADRITIEAEYEEKGHTLFVIETLSLTNTTGQKQQEVWLNLYPNAYRTEETAPVLRSEKRFAYPDGFSSGGAEVHSVLVNGREADWAFSGEQQTVLRVQLPKALPKKGSVEVTLTYTVFLPDSRLRMGYSAADVRLCNVFALPCLSREGSYASDPVGGIGDPFYSACTDWEVTLTAPESYVAAGTGCISAGQGVWRFSGEGLRDFVLVLSKEYCVRQRERNGVLLKGYAPTEEAAESLLELAGQAVEVFAEVFGEYPFEELNLCSGRLYMGGMEYPGLALIEDSLLTGDEGILEYVVAHEVAHQWFYASVGSDPILHPWQDEALAEFATLYYFEKTYGKASFASLYEGLIAPAVQSERFGSVGVEQPLSAFESTAAYDAIVYRKGAAMLLEARERMGEEAFFAALKRYVKKNAGAITQPEDFLAVFPPEVQTLLKNALHGMEEP